MISQVPGRYGSRESQYKGGLLIVSSDLVFLEERVRK
jgi:hypothetical protein